ncbi:MAG: NAD(P)(+) transhydrogenase (Re/Si-specific) subunit alpha, partial [Bacteroidetes bacterium]|nr:NAD(P)(+) transhydrogenase (Re/Si-specific) subunit alpha [Bacteroidota bacterium]
MNIGVLKEAAPETRVSLSPEVVAALVKMKVNVWVEKGAGSSAFLPDETYEQAGAKLVDKATIAEADVIL